VLARVARELVEDVAKENVRYLEARFCPSIHSVGGSSLDQIVDGVLEGLRQGSEATGVGTGLIICALREQAAGASMMLAELAAAYRGRGVVAFDLAGDESKPAEPHFPAFEHVGAAGLARIAHAGEAAGPENIREAIEKLGAERIGHGTKLLGDPSLLNEVAERGIPLEVCLTSNVHTRAVADYDGHPFARYVRQGIRVTVNTDNRTVSSTDSTHELARAFVHGELTQEELRRVVVAGVEAAFLPSDEKATLKRDFETQFDSIVAEFRSS
jgi:adenosine deaminase